MSASFEPDPRFLPRGTKVGAYTIDTLLGEGGQGVLYRVSRGSSVFTLKIATAERMRVTAAERRDIDGRLRRELATLLVIDHPNVVKAIACEWWPDVELGYPYLVMEHVEGERILRWQEETRPSLRQICGVFSQVADALRMLHEHGIIHRDLKSDNLLVRKGGTPVIIDFGIARLRSARTLTAASDILGTKTHLSPDFCRHVLGLRGEAGERYAFRPADDAHGVGVVLYEMLVGRAPFEFDEEDNDWVLMRDIASRVPPAPRELNPNVPRALDDIAMALLEKDAERRLDAPGLAAALEKALSEADAAWDVPFEQSEMVSARAKPPAPAHFAVPEPPSPPPEPQAEAPGVDSDGEKAPSEVRRVNRTGMALAAAGALAVAGLAAFFAWSGSHSTRAAPAAAPPAPGAPHEQPMSPAAKQGKPTVNDDTKPLAPAPIRTAMARSCARVVAAVGLAAAAACAHVKTGAKAGDCSFTPVREVPAPDPEHVHLPPGSKVPIPESIFVSVDPSNPGGACKGKRWESGWMEEPCPAYQGPIILETVTGDAGRYPTELEGPLPRPVQKPVLFGHTLIIPGEQTFHDSATEKDRDATGRMTALITRMRMPGGKDWPVCGVLFFNDGKEGIPILAPNTYDGPATPGWYRAEVKFYWPTP